MSKEVGAGGRSDIFQESGIITFVLCKFFLQEIGL